MDKLGALTLQLGIKPVKVRCWDDFCEEVSLFQSTLFGRLENRRMISQKKIDQGPPVPSQPFESDMSSFFHKHMLWTAFIATDLSDVILHAPINYQDSSGSQRSLTAQFMFQGEIDRVKKIDLLPIYLLDPDLEINSELTLIKVWQEIVAHDAAVANIFQIYKGDRGKLQQALMEECYKDEEIFWKKLLAGHLIAIHTQMVVAGVKYGVISTYTDNWFLRRFPLEDGTEELHISPALDISPGIDGIPMVYLGYTYVGHLAVQDGRLDMNPIQRAAVEGFTYVGPKSPPCLDGVASLVHFECEQLESGWMLHNSKTCRIFLAKYNGQLYLFKVSPASQQRANPTIKSEIRAYEALAELQGTFVPKLVFFGSLDLDSVFMAFEHTNGISADRCGRKLDKKEKAHVQQAVREIHSKGVVHNDLSAANVIVHSDRMPLLIDFKLSDVYEGKIDDDVFDSVDSLLKTL